MKKIPHVHKPGNLRRIDKLIRLRTNLIVAVIMGGTSIIASSQPKTPPPAPLDPIQMQQVRNAARDAAKEANEKQVPETAEDQWVRIQLSKGTYESGSRNGRSVNRYTSGKWIAPNGQVYNYHGKNKGQVEAFLRSQWKKWFAKSERAKTIEAAR